MRKFCLQFGFNASLIDNVFMFSCFFFHRTIMTLIELYVAEDVWLLTAEDLFTGLNGKNLFHILFIISHFSGSWNLSLFLCPRGL